MSWPSGLEHHDEFGIVVFVRRVVLVVANGQLPNWRARRRRRGVSVVERRDWLRDVERGVPRERYVREAIYKHKRRRC